MTSELRRLRYVDDSGVPSIGRAVYGWIEFHPARWASVLEAWLDTRTMLWTEYGIPVDKELHCTDYTGGRGRISHTVPDRHIRDGTPLWKDFGREVATTCLDAIRCIEGLTVGAVWRQGTRETNHATRAGTYHALIRELEDDLTADDSFALVFVDGDGSDPTYRNAHRDLNLRTRRVLEDAVHLDSRSSQLIQIADHVAWCANAHLDDHPKNAFARTWYDQYLAERDPNRTPRQL